MTGAGLISLQANNSGSVTLDGSSVVKSVRFVAVAYQGTVNIVNNASLNVVGDTTTIYDLALQGSRGLTIKDSVLSAPSMAMLALTGNVTTSNSIITGGSVTPLPNMQIYSQLGQVSIASTKVIPILLTRIVDWTTRLHHC